MRHGEKTAPGGAFGKDGRAVRSACGRPAGLPKVELVGDRELRIENHRGILAYGTEEIHVSGGAFVIQITGQGLELRAMTGLELLITGRIAGIQLA